MRPRFFATIALLVSLTLVPLSGQAQQAQEAQAETRAATQADAKTPPEAKTVPVFSLSGPVTEAPIGDDLLFGSAGGESLKDLIARMKQARDDDSVPAIVLLMDGVSMGPAQIEELRRVMDDLKKAGKPVLANVDSLSMGQYALLSGASRLSVVPTGDLFINGLQGESPYLRGLFDKINITPDFLTCGDYKSAGEMFTRRGPSPEAQENMDWLLDGIFDTQLRLIAEGRGVSKEKAKAWIDEGLYTAERALEAGIIDAVEHRQDFAAMLKKEYGEDFQLDRKYGKKKGMEIDFSSPFGVLKFYADLLSGPKQTKPSKDSIAIVYVEGPIMPGSAGDSPLSLMGAIAYSTPIRKALDEAAEDDTVKAVILRVNSPGGSAVASEIILDATRRVKAKKPLVVSMGDVAGSGGYYVACGAETIFADSATITGSIGVVSGKLCTNEAWKMLGIDWKSDSRGQNADILSGGEPFTTQQRAQMQAWMDEIYEVFKDHVVKIRGDRLKKDIDELAGGRVYTGRQALDLGLVDKLGGLDDAVAFIAEEANLDDYELRVIPKPQNLIELLFADLQDGDDDPALSLQQLLPQRSAIERALPELQGLEPERLRAVLTALTHLQVLQQERAVLAMPPILIK